MFTVDFDMLDIIPGHLALDAGCGEGRHSFAMIMRGARVFSMDLDMSSLRKTRYMLSLMRKQNQCHPAGAFQVHSGDALRLPFNDNIFDRIICSEVMEHVENDDLACREMARVLKKGGKIAITVPTFFSETAFDWLTYEYFTSPGGHIRKYIPKKLADIMDRNGFSIYHMDFRHSFHTIYWILRCVVGLHSEDHPISKAYRRFLILCDASGFISKIERFFDYFFPKSMIFYAYKR